MNKKKRLSPIPLTGKYDIRHIKKTKGQKNILGMDLSMFLRVQKVRSEMTDEIESLGITEKDIIKFRRGGSYIDHKSLTEDQKHRLAKQSGLLTARTIFSRYFDEYYNTPEEKAKWKKEWKRLGVK